MADELTMNALQQLSNSTVKKKLRARIRDWYPEIVALKANGFSHATIVETLNNLGWNIDLRVFEVTFYLIKKERAAKTAISDGITTPCAPVAQEPKPDHKAPVFPFSDPFQIGKGAAKLGIDLNVDATPEIESAPTELANGTSNTDGLSKIQIDLLQRTKKYPPRNR